MEKRKKRRTSDYRDNIGKLTEYILIRSIFLLLLLLLTIQATLLFLPQLGTRLNTALSLEGRPIDSGQMIALAGSISTDPWAIINLRLLNYTSLPEVIVLVDGKEVAGFIHNEVTINVKQGSIIAVRNSNQQRPVTVIVINRTPNIQKPVEETSVSGSGTLFFEPVVIE